MKTMQGGAMPMEIGVVGLGLMGSSIVVALLMAGHRVVAIAPLPGDMENAEGYIRAQLQDCEKAGLLEKHVDSYISKLIISEDYEKLENCGIVMECVVENVQIKAGVYRKIESIVDNETIVASNTSAIPISELQYSMRRPERFLGIHWAEPAFVTRFLEITCGALTNHAYAGIVWQLAHSWGKEPTVLKKDIRGFITNRLMYAVYRELFHLVDEGVTTIENADKACRYDFGSWITLMGIFRRMDYLGLVDCRRILERNFPKLCNTGNVPRIMQNMVNSNARGTQNLVGLYNYNPEEAKAWEEAFALFNKDIYKLASHYPLRKLEMKINKATVF